MQSDNNSCRSKRKEPLWAPKDPLGLDVVLPPRGEHKVDVIFIHGLRASSRQTWTRGTNPNNLWPREALPYEPWIGGVRVATFGYEAQFTSEDDRPLISVLDVAKTLLHDLKNTIDTSSSAPEGLSFGEKPTILVGHSFGGLIVKEAYVQALRDPEYTDTANAITAVVFLATPHSNVRTQLGQDLSRIFKSLSLPVAELESATQTLQTLNDSFQNVSGRLKIASLYETLPTLMGEDVEMVLEMESSVMGCEGETTRSLKLNHREMGKAELGPDEIYRTIRDILKDLVSQNRSENETS